MQVQYTAPKGGWESVFLISMVTLTLTLTHPRKDAGDDLISFTTSTSWSKPLKVLQSVAFVAKAWFILFVCPLWHVPLLPRTDKWQIRTVDENHYFNIQSTIWLMASRQTPRMCSSQQRWERSNFHNQRWKNDASNPECHLLRGFNVFWTYIFWWGMWSTALCFAAHLWCRMWRTTKELNKQKFNWCLNTCCWRVFSHLKKNLHQHFVVKMKFAASITDTARELAWHHFTYLILPVQVCVCGVLWWLQLYCSPFLLCLFQGPAWMRQRSTNKGCKP